MKHIKTYEAIEDELKEFIIIRDIMSTNILHNITNSKHNYYIGGYPESSYPKNIWINFNYERCFKNDMEERSCPYGNMFMRISDIKNQIIFQSNKLKDCLDYLEISKTTDKYNL